MIFGKKCNEEFNGANIDKMSPAVERDYIVFALKHCKENCSDQRDNSFDIFALCLLCKNSRCINIEHPDNYPIKLSRNFFKADNEARKMAGLEDKAGSYEFICPNCGEKCGGSWLDSGHGHTGCQKCGITLII